MKKILSLLLAGALAFSMTGCGQKEEAKSDASTAAKEEATSDIELIKKNGKLVVGITDYAPMDYKEEGSDEWTGFDAEFATAFAKELGVEVEFVEIDWDNKFLELDDKKIDCIWNGMTITDEVKNNTSVSNAYAKNEQIVVLKADKAAEYKSVDDLKGLTFAVENGSAGASAAEEVGLDTVEVGAQTDTLMEVESGTADGAIIDSTMAEAMIGEGTSYADLATSISLTKEEYGVGFRKGSDLVDKFNEFVTSSKDLLSELSSKYGVGLVD